MILKNNGIGVVVARLQTTELTDGQRFLLDTVYSKHKTVVIVLGVSPLLNSDRNPLDYATREGMVKAAYPNIVVLPLKDHRNDKIWTNNLDKLIRSIFSLEEVYLYGSRDSFLKAYSGKFKVVNVEPTFSYCGSDLRNEAVQKHINSKSFRSGVIYGQAKQYPKTVPCVDVAITSNTEEPKVLLAFKNGEPGWRFPGGHVEGIPLEQTVFKEVLEETSCSISQVNYIASFIINDWRYNGEKSNILSAFFEGIYHYGPCMAGDDVDQVSWFKLSEFTLSRSGQIWADTKAQFLIVPEHIPLVLAYFTFKGYKTVEVSSERFRWIK